MKQELPQSVQPTESELLVRLQLAVAELSDAFKKDRDGDISSIAGEIRALESALYDFQQKT